MNSRDASQNGERDSLNHMTSPEDLAQEIRLRGEHPRVTRLSRKVLAGGVAVALALVSAATIWALHDRRSNGPAQGKLYSTERHRVADGLAMLPQDYAGVPRQVPALGPPLPGDLGRPILAAQGQAPVASPIGLDQEQQRREQETEAARVSRVFATTNVHETASSSTTSAPGDRTASPNTQAADDGFAQNGQDRKLAFVNSSVDRRTTSPDRVSKPASPYVLQAGAVIPAALITGVRSDLPGQITAQVTENIFDTPTGGMLLVPQGARLVGIYDSQIAFGQSRILLVWTRLLLPNGRSIVLERQPGADAGGYAGLNDDVDNHWGEVFKAAALSTFLSVGTELGSSSDNNNSNGSIIQALRRGTSDSLNQVGQQVVRRSLNIQPTLTIRPGFPVRVIVNRDLVLERYRG